MNKSVFCSKNQEHLPALEKAPLKGKIGEIILAHTSQKAWDEWLDLQMKVINEERLDLSETKAQQRLFELMVEFLKIGEFVGA